MQTEYFIRKDYTSMKKISIVLVALWALTTALTAQPLAWLNVASEGADSKGVNLSTAIIQSCIDKAASQGGGVVYFPAGTYLTGAIKLKSNITLHIDAVPP
jgi:polygalacturonase